MNSYVMSPLLQSPLTIEHALLGFLRQSPMHGYEIYQRMSDANGLGTVWRIKQSHLYALLTRLEKEGLVRSTLEPQGVHPPRKVFHLTPTGEEAFLDWVQHGVDHGRDIRLDFLVKFYFAQPEGTALTLRLIERQRMACQNWLTRQQAVADSLGDDQPFERLVNQFRMGQTEAMLHWLDACEQTVSVIEPVA
jgi:DNA-binding PadR family transcriptional regulator